MPIADNSPGTTTGATWRAVAPDRFSCWFTCGRDPELDASIRSPGAPPENRIAALEQWLASKPNRVVLGYVSVKDAGKYSPVAEYLRARLRDAGFSQAPYSGAVWIAIARSGWLGEWAAEKRVSWFIGMAGLPLSAIPQLTAAAVGYVPDAREYLCSRLHARAASKSDVAERIALYGWIHQLMSVP